MITVNMYNRETVEASKSALVEVVIALQSYSKFFVLVGGWAPYFIIERFCSIDEFSHCGSIDIDLVMDSALNDESQYETIVELLQKRDYIQLVQNRRVVPFRFVKEVRSPVDKRDYLIHLDLITEPDQIRLQENLIAAAVPGCSIAFEHLFQHKIKGILPGNGKVTVDTKIVNLVGCLAMKGIALARRLKEKDDYDIYSVIKYFKKGPIDAAKEFNTIITDSNINSALQTIREKFLTSSSQGPYSVANFLTSLDTDKPLHDRVRTDAFMQVDSFFKYLSR